MSDPRFDKLFLNYPEAVRPIDPPLGLGGAGGHSGARLWRYRAAAGQFVLRAWPVAGPGRERLEQVHRWLAHTADLKFIPVPIQDSSGQSLREYEGRFWEIAPWLNGAPDCNIAPSSEHRRAAFTALAAFHRRLASLGNRGPSPGLFERHQSLRHLIDGGFDRLESVCLHGPNTPHAPTGFALRWIGLARRLAGDIDARVRSAVSREVVLQPCLRDARPEHFLFEGEHLTGLVDFGAMDIETIAADLARLIGEWLEGDRLARRDALGAYEAIRLLDPAELALIDVFEASAAILIGERWSRWHFFQHRTFDDPQAVARGIAKSIAQMDRLLEKSPSLPGEL